MAIYITVKSENEALSNQQLALLHDALQGSASYIESEIALVSDTESSFILAVGEENEHDVDIELINISINPSSTLNIDPRQVCVGDYEIIEGESEEDGSN